MITRLRRYLSVWLLLASLYLSSSIAVASQEEATWILIDTVALRADVYRGKSLVTRFRGIAIGSGGTTLLRRSGDSTTPLGEFRITRINYDSRFRIFMGLDYPTLNYAERAYKAGYLDELSYMKVLEASIRQEEPPQNTVLGGNIGIHGLGGADPEIHQRVNWTKGCIAMTNQQIEQLATLVKIGTRVFIR